MVSNFNKGQRQVIGKGYFLPFIKEQGKIYFVKRFEIQLNSTQKARTSSVLRSSGFSSSSVLRDGDWHKISVLESGIYSMSYSFLKDNNLVNEPLEINSIRLLEMAEACYQSQI